MLIWAPSWCRVHAAFEGLLLHDPILLGLRDYLLFPRFLPPPLNGGVHQVLEWFLQLGTGIVQHPVLQVGFQAEVIIHQLQDVIVHQGMMSPKIVDRLPNIGSQIGNGPVVCRWHGVGL